MTPTRTEGRCAWLREAIAPGEIDAPALEGHHRADICVVGGGIVGLAVARRLHTSHPGSEVSLVEKEPGSVIHPHFHVTEQFQIVVSIDYLAMIIIGGLGSIPGAFGDRA